MNGVSDRLQNPPARASPTESSREPCERIGPRVRRRWRRRARLGALAGLDELGEWLRELGLARLEPQAPIGDGPVPARPRRGLRVGISGHSPLRMEGLDHREQATQSPSLLLLQRWSPRRSHSNDNSHKNGRVRKKKKKRKLKNAIEK